jgi:lipopolysaccharide exporter
MSIQKKMAAGAIWMVFAKLVDRSLGFVSTLILARVLIPHDFGIVAMAMSFVALIELLGAFGLGTTLIQTQTKERRHWDTVWTIQILVGATVALLMFLFARLVADFYNEPDLTNVIRVLAIGPLVQGFQNVGIIGFQMDMRFDREFLFMTSKKLITMGTTIPLVFMLDSYWALVIGQTTGRLAATALSYWVHPYRPRLALHGTGDLFHFSKWLFAIHIISYLKERSSDLIIGRMSGPAALGTFSVSYELASLPSTELVAPINRAVFPAYAKLAAESRQALSQEYLSVIGLIMLLAVPAVLGVAASAPLLIPVVLGQNWLDAIPVVTVLALFGFTNLVQTNAQAAYVALGRADVPAKMNIFHVAIQILALVPLTRSFGVTGAAFAYLVTATVMIPISIGVILRMLRISVLQFLARVWRPLVAAAIMFVTVRQYAASVGVDLGTAAAVAHLAVAIAIGVVVYVGTVAVLWLVSQMPGGAEQAVVSKFALVTTRLLARKGALS